MCFNILPQAQQGRNHIELGTKKMKPSKYDWFSKDICKLFLARNKTYIKLIGCNSIMNKVKVYFHMLGPTMKHRIGREINSSNVVTP
jgi:hypothetical protein